MESWEAKEARRFREKQLKELSEGLRICVTSGAHGPYMILGEYFTRITEAIAFLKGIRQGRSLTR